jgi:hypothetical protein
LTALIPLEKRTDEVSARFSISICLENNGDILLYPIAVQVLTVIPVHSLDMVYQPLFQIH